MRKLLRTSVLVLALAVPAFAGDIPYMVTSPPPPPPDATQQGDIQSGVTGDIPNMVTGEIPYDITLSVLVALLVAPLA